jgi:hypothetical protein
MDTDSQCKDGCPYGHYFDSHGVCIGPCPPKYVISKMSGECMFEEYNESVNQKYGYLLVALILVLILIVVCYCICVSILFKRPRIELESHLAVALA